MKLNRKGFMMAEVVVVSSVILIILTTLYISYNKIFSIYETRLNYEDSNLVYALAYYRDVSIESGKLLNAINTMGTMNYPVSTSLGIDTSALGYSDRVFLVKGSNITGLKEASGASEKTFQEYIDYLSTSTNFDEINYVMIMARCENNTKKEKCKYAHLDLEV